MMAEDKQRKERWPRKLGGKVELRNLNANTKHKIHTFHTDNILVLHR